MRYGESETIVSWKKQERIKYLRLQCGTLQYYLQNYPELLRYEKAFAKDYNGGLGIRANRYNVPNQDMNHTKGGV